MQRAVLISPYFTMSFHFSSLFEVRFLMIIFFKNTEMEAIKYEEALDIREIYDRAVVEKFNFEQRLIVNELRKYGIYSILTEPRYLTVDLINKYLEVKARGLI